MVSVAMARPATSPQYAWLVTCSRSQSAPSIAECVAAPPMRGEYHLAAVRAGGGHQADQQRVEEGGDTLRGQGAPEREGPATTNQVSVFRAYQPIRAEYSEGGNLTDNEQILGKFKTSTSNN